MTDQFPARAGAVLSADIAVPEHGREAAFYSRVLSTGTNPLWRAEDLMSSAGVPILGLGERTAEHDALPIQWMPHIQVKDVGSSVERAAEHGGSVLMKGENGGTVQWAVLRDPDGAAFGVIPVVQAIPSSLTAQDRAVGRILWLDLTTRDATRTRDFYRNVIQWDVRDVEMKDGDARYADYNMLDESGAPAAGVCHARGTNADLPPVWMLYLPVGSLEESMRRAEEEGGGLVRTARNSKGETQYAIVQDPVGAVFALVQG